MTEWDFYQNLINYITGPQFGNRVLLWLIVFIIVLTILQYSKLPVYPWSMIGRAIGKSLNADIIQQQEKIRSDVEKLRIEMNKTDSGIRAEIKLINQNRDIDKVELWRSQIIRFADEIRVGLRHSEEGFNEVLEAITRYEQFCIDHPKFPNSKATASIRLIKKTYEQCLKNDAFI
ncbi:hypothetical protein [Lachnoclostridium sp. Marseille-P6806]|uniref:hypothetical protein n=1 Tax=Lachnoclostridium sp. Marseille-P6806 TaxID=2364793 RepID=UPI0010302C97|nr:hypothetical protein [Lachnoclostridium sp. Marseille-P6806]